MSPIRENAKKITAAILISGILILGISQAAYADPAPTPTPTPTFTGGPDPVTVTTYDLVAWTLGPNSTPADPFTDPQHVFSHVGETFTPVSLDLLDSGLACGKTYQVDLYVDGTEFQTLLAGGILTAPSQPNPEPLAYGAPGLTGNPWKYVTTPACVTPTPTPTPVVTTPPATPKKPTLATTGYVFPWGVFWFFVAIIALGIILIRVSRKFVRSI